MGSDTPRSIHAFGDYDIPKMVYGCLVCILKACCAPSHAGSSDAAPVALNEAKLQPPLSYAILMARKRNCWAGGGGFSLKRHSARVRT